MTPVFPVTLALYAASCAFYLALLAAIGPASASTERLDRAARITLAAAFLSHAVDIAILCVKGVHPFINVREVLSFVGWLTVGSYLALSLRMALPLLGAVIVPLTLVLDVAARLGPEHAAGADHVPMAFIKIAHIGLVTAGITAFAVAAGDAVVYLYAERRLKAHRLQPKSPLGMPSLEALDRLHGRCLQLGFPIYTIAMITGAIWLMRLAHDGAHRLLEPQYAMATVAWVIFAGLLLARFLVGWRGRRAALLTLGGFAAALSVLVIYYVRGLTGA